MNKQGFTLVELVVGIVVLAVAMMIMNTMLISQSRDALEPLYRLRASQLGQSIMQNILTRAYDENSDHNGGLYRCGEEWQTDGLTHDCATILGPDGSEADDGHQNFNDADDFITDNPGSDDFELAVDYGDVIGNELSSQYNNYQVKIEVSNVTSSDSKKIAVIIKTPSNEEIRFSALKGNY